MLRTIRRPTRVAHLVAHPRPTLVCQRQLATPNQREPVREERVHLETDTLKESRVGPERKAEVDTQWTASSSPAPVPLDISQVGERLRRWGMQHVPALRERMDTFSSAAHKAFRQLGGRVNEMTGYLEIEALKKLVAENERKMHEIREEAKAAKAAYEEAVSRRSNSQRETNELLQRKSTWTDADVMRFTQLVRADHVHEQDEARAQAHAAEADAATERQFAELMRAILSRYHEEQVWSDKIRSASTYGSLAALGLNLMVFILAIILVEPWKRKRLVQSFERRVIELNEANQRVVEEGLKELRAHQEQQEDVLAEIRATQASLKEGQVPAAMLRADSKGEVSSSVLATEFERSAKSARDRQILALSATGVLGAGLVGFVLGSWFS